jgi:hypothetical protein
MVNTCALQHKVFAMTKFILSYAKKALKFIEEAQMRRVRRVMRSGSRFE